MNMVRYALAAGVAWGALVTPALAQATQENPEQQVDSGDVETPTPEDDSISADPSAPQGPVQADPANQEDIVITVDRREQNLQDYAGTAAAFEGDDLRARGIQDITDMNDVLPGLTVANNGGNVEIWIRGVGSSNNTELGDPAAAFHFDGVYVPRPSGIGSAFFDIERVEVNVGPQGTLRGRNATAGSVNAISWKPGIGVWDAAVEVGYGNYDHKEARGMINIPIGDNAAFRFAGMFMAHDSYYENVGPIQEIDVAEAENNKAFRAQFLWEPTDRLSILLAGEYIHEEGTGYTGTNYANPLGNGIDPDDIKDPRKVIANAFTPDLDTKHWSVRGTVRYEAEPFTIEYTASYRDLLYNYDATTPLTPAYPGVIDNLSVREDAINGGFVDPDIVLEETFDNWSRFQFITDSESHFHELRLFQDEGDFIWSVGGLYFREDQYSFLGAAADRTPFFSGIEFNMPDVDAESYAVYGDATWKATDKLSVTAGLRFTKDKKSREGIAARYAFILGDGNFNCCMGVRVGTEGFQFAGKGRTIFNPDTNGDGTISNEEILAFYFDGVAQFGLRDNVDDIFENGVIEGHFGFVPGVPFCEDTVTGDPLTCDGFEPSGQFTYGFPFPGQIFRQSGKMKDNFIDWRLRAQYDITPDNMVYALVATGHKSGGFNDNLGDLGVAPTYDTEQVRLYEIGTKNEFWLGNVKARLNGSLFYNDYKDQVFTSILSVAQAVDFLEDQGQNIIIPDGTSFDIVVSYSYNAADSEIYGANIEGGFQFPHNINFDFNLLWLEAKINNAEPIQDFRFQADIPDAVDDAVFRSINGKRLPRTPRWQMNFTLSQKIDVPTGFFDYVISAGYRSSQFQTIFNSEDFRFPDNPRLRLNDKVEGYWTFDVGAGYTHGPEGKLRFEVYGNNIFDAVHEAAIIITQFDNTRFFTRPRTFGGRVRIRY